jgi:hypothetical protein
MGLRQESHRSFVPLRLEFQQKPPPKKERGWLPRKGSTDLQHQRPAKELRAPHQRPEVLKPPHLHHPGHPILHLPGQTEPSKFQSN